MSDMNVSMKFTLTGDAVAGIKTIEGVLKSLDVTISGVNSRLSTFSKTAVGSGAVESLKAQGDAAKISAEQIAYQIRLAKSVSEAAKLERAAQVEDARRAYDEQVRLGNQAAALEKAHLAAIREDRKRAADIQRADTRAVYDEQVRLGNQAAALEKAHLAAIREDRKRAATDFGQRPDEQIATEAQIRQATLAMRKDFAEREADNAAAIAGRSLGTLGKDFASLTWEMARIAFGLGVVIKGALAPAIAGFKLQKEMEDAQVGITGILVSMTNLNGKVMDFQNAWRISGELVKEVQADSIRYGVKMGDIVNTFRSILAPGIGAGMNVEQIRQLAAVGSVAVSAIGLPAQQMVQEIRDLVTGGIQASQNTLATALGITGADILKIQREGGDLFKFLMDRLKGFGEVAEETRKSTLSGSWDIFTGKLERMLASTEGFAQLKGAVSSLTDALDSPATKDAINGYWKALIGISDMAGKAALGVGLILDRIDKLATVTPTSSAGHPIENLAKGLLSIAGIKIDKSVLDLFVLINPPQSNFEGVASSIGKSSIPAAPKSDAMKGSASNDAITKNFLTEQGEVNKAWEDVYKKHETDLMRHNKTIEDITKAGNAKIAFYRRQAVMDFTNGNVQMAKEHEAIAAQTAADMKAEIDFENERFNKKNKDKTEELVAASAKAQYEIEKNDLKNFLSVIKKMEDDALISHTVYLQAKVDAEAAAAKREIEILRKLQSEQAEKGDVKGAIETGGQIRMKEADIAVTESEVPGGMRKATKSDIADAMKKQIDAMDVLINRKEAQIKKIKAQQSQGVYSTYEGQAKEVELAHEEAAVINDTILTLQTLKTGQKEYDDQIDKTIEKLKGKSTDLSSQQLLALKQLRDAAQAGFTSMFENFAFNMDKFGLSIQNVLKQMVLDFDHAFLSMIAKHYGEQLTNSLFPGGGQGSGGMNWILQIGASAAGAPSSTKSSDGANIGNTMNAPQISLAVGTNRVPKDMIAQIHKDEIVVPPYDANVLRQGGNGARDVTVHNTFLLNEPTNTRTQSQIAAAAAAAAASATRRNG